MFFAQEWSKTQFFGPSGIWSDEPPRRSETFQRHCPLLRETVLVVSFAIWIQGIQRRPSLQIQLRWILQSAVIEVGIWNPRSLPQRIINHWRKRTVYFYLYLYSVSEHSEKTKLWHWHRQTFLNWSFGLNKERRRLWFGHRLCLTLSDLSEDTTRWDWSFQKSMKTAKQRVMNSRGFGKWFLI